MKHYKKVLTGLFYSMRPGQWVKNLSVFAAIIFNGKLFDPVACGEAFLAFVVFSLLSSAAYLINDIKDAPYDRLHPLKRNRPIAKGDITTKQAVSFCVLLLSMGLTLAFSLNPGFTLLAIMFIALHFTYSFYLKKQAVLDILGISFSFIIRVFGGELATGYHLPVWLTFTVIFLSLFIASGKRRSELVKQGAKTRPVLTKYQKSLLNFYTSIFAVSTLISYSLFAYLARPVSFENLKFRQFLILKLPELVDRKWLMLTIFPVIFGIMRYSQLVFERCEGQRPEKLLLSDIPLLAIISLWGVMVVTIIYGL